MTHIKLSLLGTLQIQIDGEPLTHFESIKVRALLAYLAAEAGKPQDRGKLAGLLWPDWPEEAAQKNLRHSLYSLRKALGDPACLEADRHSLRLAPGADCQVDTLALETALNNFHTHPTASASLLAAAEGYRGPFLEGFHVDDSPAYEEWILNRRAHHLRQILEAFSLLADWHEQRNEPVPMEKYARRQLELEPWREEAHCQLMRALALQGKRSQALAQYELCRKALQDDLDAQPSEATNRLYAQIQAERFLGKPEAVEPAVSALMPRSRHNLPRQLSLLVGREQEIQEIQSRLASAPLVTVIGSGGMGKSRLALHVAECSLERYADGAWWVDLAPISHPELVPLTIARSVGMTIDARPDVLSALLAYLQPRQALLVLDNCEHLVETCAQVADSILRACPQVTILATSREKLAIDGEALYPLIPLTLPDAHQSLDLNLAQTYEAVRLFALRAEAARPGFRLEAGNIQAVTQICTHLDGIPLAIELAAARVSAMRVEEIAAHLGDCFSLLSVGRRATLPRHQTLRASIEWSYNLLSPTEQCLLQCCSVFSGDWSLEAAEAVGSGAAIERSQVMLLLSQLVDKSLVSTIFRAEQPTRYRLLETIQRFASEKLAEAGQREAALTRHLKYYDELVDKIEGRLRSPDMPHLLVLLEAELENLRQALDYSLKTSDLNDWRMEAGLRIASGLHWFWHPRNRHFEGVGWLERLLAAEETTRGGEALPTARKWVRAKALFVAAWMAGNLGDYTKLKNFGGESHRLFSDLGPAGRRGVALNQILESLQIWNLGDYPECKRLLEESRSILMEEGDLFGASEACLNLAIAAIDFQDYETAHSLFQERLRLSEAINDPDGIAGGQSYMGQLYFLQGDLTQARHLWEQSLKAFWALHNELGVSLLVHFLTTLEGLQGNYALAEKLAEEMISLGQREGNERTQSNGLARLGMLALAQDQVQKAAACFSRILALGHTHLLDIIPAPLWWLGIIAWEKGEFSQAAEKFYELLELSRVANHPMHMAFTRWGLGRVYFAQGNLVQARAHIFQALETYKNLINESWDMIYVLEELAYTDFTLGQAERAARLLGVTEAYHQRYKNLRTSKERTLRSQAIEALRRVLDEATFNAAWEAGAAMSAGEAVEYALERCRTM